MAIMPPPTATQEVLSNALTGPPLCHSLSHISSTVVHFKPIVTMETLYWKSNLLVRLAIQPSDDGYF